MAVIDEYALSVQDPSQFKISTYPSLTATNARKFIKTLLDGCNMAVNLNDISPEELISEGKAIEGEAAADGIVWCRVHLDSAVSGSGYEGTNDYPVLCGSPVCFDTVTGDAVTGVNPNWGTDEYKVVGVAMMDWTTAGYGWIPVRIGDVSSDVIEPQEIWFINDEPTSATSAVPQYAVFQVTQCFTDTDGEVKLRCRRPAIPPPDTNNQPILWAVNVSDGEIETGAYGKCYLLHHSINFPLTIKYENASGAPTPTIGDWYGPRSRTDWAVIRGVPFLRVIGNIDTSAGTFMAVPSQLEMSLACQTGSSDVLSYSCQRIRKPFCKGNLRGHGMLEYQTFTNIGEGSSQQTGPHVPVLVRKIGSEVDQRSFVGETAIAKPEMALIFTGETAGTAPTVSMHGQNCGPDPRPTGSGGQDKLIPFLPGFICLMAVDTASTGTPKDVLPVIRDNSPAIAIAVAAWANGDTNHGFDTVLVRACGLFASTGIPGFIYDGSANNRPLIEFTVYVPKPGRQRATNIQIGDQVLYRFESMNGSLRAISVGDYGDDPIGTIKLYNFTTVTLPPPGWYNCDGTNSTPDLRGRFIVNYDDRGGGVPAHSDALYVVGSTGGNKTHTHAAHALTHSGGAGSATVGTPDQGHDTVNHIPPWYASRYIIRAY